LRHAGIAITREGAPPSNRIHRTWWQRAERRLNHIFGAVEHNLEPLVQQLGSRQGVIRAILSALKGLTPASGQFEVSVQVAGQSVVVRGAVVNGVVKIGTAFTP
jgi:hypothetical protein